LTVDLFHQKILNEILDLATYKNKNNLMKTSSCLDRRPRRD